TVAFYIAPASSTRSKIQKSFKIKDLRARPRSGPYSLGVYLTLRGTKGEERSGSVFSCTIWRSPASRGAAFGRFLPVTMAGPDQSSQQLCAWHRRATVGACAYPTSSIQTQTHPRHPAAGPHTRPAGCA